MFREFYSVLVLKKDTYFCAQFQRISSHRGKKRAYVAVAHSMLTAIYHMLKDGVVFKDPGADYCNHSIGNVPAKVGKAWLQD